MFGPATLNTPPPNPVTDPAAARETSKLGMLTGGAAPGRGGMPAGGGPPGPPGMGGPAGPGGPSASPTPGGPGALPAGPDITGLVALGGKVDEAILTLAAVMPPAAAQLDQARELIANAVANFLQSQGTAPGIPGVPGGNAAAPRGGGIVQAGNQFPGGGFGQGRVA